MRRVDRLLERYGEIAPPSIEQADPLVLRAAHHVERARAVAGGGAARRVRRHRACARVLSPPLAAGMLVVAAATVYPLFVPGDDVSAVAIGVFVAAWIGQFIGHAIEGRKPSYFDDVTFLLVGPV